MYRPSEKMTEQIDGASFGTSGILNSLFQLERTIQRPYWDVLLINVGTLIRNNLTTGAANKAVQQGVVHDLQTLVRHFGEYLERRKVPMPPPIAVCYLPNYQHLPSAHRRPPNAQTQQVDQISALLTKQIEPMTKELPCTIRHGVEVYELVAGQRMLPHHEVKLLVDAICQKRKIRINLNFGLISHSAIDLHLQNYWQRLWLFESHTGQIRDRSTFGTKVFKNDFLPFNRYTHLLFGDQTYIRPLVQRAEKQRLYELAKDRGWRFRPAKEILDDIRKQGIVPVDLLTHVPL